MENWVLHPYLKTSLAQVWITWVSKEKWLILWTIQPRSENWQDGTSASELKDFFSEYPILNEKILNDLDGESLLKLRKTCPKSYAAVTSVKLFWVKKIQNSITNIEEYQEVWKKVVGQKSVKVIMEVALAVKEFFKTCNTKRVKQHVGLHFSPLLLNLDSSDNSIKVFLPNKFAMTS